MKKKGLLRSTKEEIDDIISKLEDLKDNFEISKDDADVIMEGFEEFTKRLGIDKKSVDYVIFNNLLKDVLNV